MMLALQNLRRASRTTRFCRDKLGRDATARLWQCTAVVSTPVNIGRIDFISAYCDSWCERCAFTSRCSSYAVQVAIAMCDDDLGAALGLAVGAPPCRPAETASREAFVDELSYCEPTGSEINGTIREETEREDRQGESSLTTSVAKFTTLAWHWTKSNPEGPILTAAPQLAEAIKVGRWDASLIGAKLHRALHGLDECTHGEAFEDDPVQNDRNGSAKVALISIRRSILAWTTIAEVRGDAEAALIADELRYLEIAVERTFRNAWRFRRSGFDQNL